MGPLCLTQCMDHPGSGVALTGCGSGTIRDLFLKSRDEIESEQLDSVDVPTTDCNHIKRSTPHVLIGRREKATKLH